MRNACSRTLCALAVGLGWVQAGLAVDALQPQPLPAISATSNQSVSSQGDSTSRLASYSDSVALSAADSRPNLSPCSDGSCQTDCVGRWRDNVEIWSVGDDFRNIGDVVPVFQGGVPVIANFGLRTVVNSGFALGNSKIRGQIGGSLGVYDLQ